MDKLIILALLFSFLLHTECRAGGAPEDACLDMTPKHFFPAQTSPVPMDITLSSNIFNENTTIDITLKHNNGTRFIGVLAQMRMANSSNATLFGSFVGDNRNFREACNESRAITHSRALRDLDEIKFTWKPSQVNADAGPLQLWITVVQKFSIFWVQVKSEVLTYNISASVTTAPASTTPGTTLSPTREVDLTECGTSKDCFKIPENCDKEDDCDYLLTWKPENQGEIVNFEISAKTTSDPFWTSVAFSKDLLMGDDSVIDCLVNSSTNLVEVQASWNERRSNVVLNNKLLGLVSGSISGTKDNDRIRCRFQRQTIISKSDANKIYDLNTEYYVFLGKGLVLPDGLKMQHLQIPKKSDTKLLMTTKKKKVPTATLR